MPKRIIIPKRRTVTLPAGHKVTGPDGRECQYAGTTYQCGTSCDIKSFKAADDAKPNVLMTVSGFASTDDVDSYNEIVRPSAFEKTMASYMEFPLVLENHKWYDLGVGMTTGYEIRDSGLWVENDILATRVGEDVATLVDAKLLRAFSIGYSVDKDTPPDDEDEPGTPTYIDQLTLWEYSYVNVPANRQALFDEAAEKGITIKSLVPPMRGLVPGTDLDDDKTTNQPGRAVVGAKKGKVTMDPEELKALKKKMEDTGTTVTDISSRLGEMQGKFGELATMQTQLIDIRTRLDDGLVTRADFKGYVDRQAEEFLQIKDALETARKAVAVRDAPTHTAAHVINRSPSLMKHYDDKGFVLPPNKLRMHQLLLTPVQHDGSDAARTLHAFRNTTDVMVMTDAYFRGRASLGMGDHYQGVRSLKSFELWKELLGEVDPDFYKAMYSTGTGVGDEWVPTIMSQLLFDEIRSVAALESAFPVYNMPSQPAEYPIHTSLPQMYIMGEAVSNNPDKAIKSDSGSSKVTFTAKKGAVCIVVADELVEDAIFDMASQLRMDIAKAQALGWESAYINGDTAGTHQDTGETAWDATRAETHILGLRAEAKDRTSEVAGGGTTITAALMRSTRAHMGDYGVSPSEVLYITSNSVYFDILSLNQFTQQGTYNAGATWITGVLPTQPDGCQLIVTSKLRETFATTGLYTTPSTLKVFIAVNKTAWRVGMRKQITLDYGRDMFTGQIGFIAHARKDFKTLCGTATVKPVATCVNVA